MYMFTSSQLVGIYIAYCLSRRTHAGTEERCEEEGMREKNHHILTITPSPCAIHPFLKGPSVASGDTKMGRSLDWRSKAEPGKGERKGTALVFAFLLPTTLVNNKICILIVSIYSQFSQSRICFYCSGNRQVISPSSSWTFRFFLPVLVFSTTAVFPG